MQAGCKSGCNNPFACPVGCKPSRPTATPYTMAHHILVAEDQTDIRDLIVLNLRQAGHDVVAVGDGLAALAYQTAAAGVGAGVGAGPGAGPSAGAGAAPQRSADLLVLDLMLPGMDGLEVCKALRAKGVATPILMLTAKSTELDRVLGLELGADDYLSKPFSMAELLARVKALLRRAELLRVAQAAQAAQTTSTHTQTVRNGDLEIWPVKREVRVGQQVLDFTALEFELLLHFAQHPGRVFSRSQLLDAVWGYSHDGYEHTVTTHINRLRAKVEADPINPRLILTVRGAGYKMRDVVA
jgi:DNA-binding response OmpR family regulator